LPDKRIEIRIDKEFWEERIEPRLREEGYKGATELIKDLLRRWLKENQKFD